MKKILMTLSLGLLMCIGTVLPVRAASVATLQAQEKKTQKGIATISTSIQKTLTSVNAKDTQARRLSAKITHNQAQLKEIKRHLQAQQQQLSARKAYAKQKLRALQRTTETQRTIMTLANAKSVTDLFNRIYIVTILQEADKRNRHALADSYRQTQATQANLAQTKADLTTEKITLDKQTQALQAQIKQLKKELATSQAQLEQLTKAEKVAQAQQTAKQKAVAQAKAAAQQQATDAAKLKALTAAQKQPLKQLETAEIPLSLKGQATGKQLKMQATAYSIATPGMGRYGATGIDLLKTPQCIAVDPKVIPLNSLVFVSGYGYAVAGDTGSAIKGQLIDVHFPTNKQCIAWGRRQVTVTLLK